MTNGSLIDFRIGAKKCKNLLQTLPYIDGEKKRGICQLLL